MRKKNHTIFTVLPDSGTFGRGWLIGVWSQVEISPRGQKKEREAVGGARHNTSPTKAHLNFLGHTTNAHLLPSSDLQRRTNLQLKALFTNRETPIAASP